MAFKLTLIADVRQWLKGTQDVEDSLDDVSGSLKDLADDSEKGATEASEAMGKLERKLKDAADAAEKTGKSGRDIGDGITKGAREAEDGLEKVKEEGNDTAREVAASFDGSAESIAEGFQEVAANAFGGFGPAGQIAGLAAAAGIGLVISGLQSAADAALESKERVLDLADAIEEAGGDPALIDWAVQLRETMKTIVDSKEWFEFWQQSPVDKLTDWTAKAKTFGVAMADVVRSQAGDTQALLRVQDKLRAQQDALNQQARDANLAQEGSGEAFAAQAREIGNFSDAVGKGTQEVQDAAEWQRIYAETTQDLQKPLIDAATAATEFADALGSDVSDAISDMSDDFDKVKGSTKSVFDPEDWVRDIEEIKRASATLTRKLERIQVKWSPEQVQGFTTILAKEGTKGALAWVQAYEKAGPKLRRRMRDALTPDKPKLPDVNAAEVKVTGKVKIPTRVEKPSDVGVAAAAAAAAGVAMGHPVKYPSAVQAPKVPTVADPSKPITYRTKTDPAGANKGAQAAADSAQRVANQARNRIEYRTKVNATGLQGAVNRVAAGIRPPTIYVDVVPRKKAP